MKNVAIEEILANDRFVRGLAISLMGDSAAADDVAQEAYLRAMQKGPREGGSVRGWLSTVIRNIAANVGRGARRRARRERLAGTHEARDPASLIVEREELRRRLLKAILELGTPRSTIVLMRYFEGAPPRAIAKKLGMPVETVRTHLKRSVAVLRERLGSETRPDGTSVLMALPILAAGSPHLGASIGIAIMSLKTKVALASACVLVAVSVFVATKIDWSPDSTKAPAAGTGTEAESASTARAVSPSRPIVGAAFQEPAPPESLPHDAIGVVVVDEAGAPVIGARVFVCDAGAAGSLAVTSDAKDSGVPNGTTDANGRFAIALQPPDRILTVCATARGFSPAILTPAAMGTRVTLTLARAARIIGRTLDTAGEPVKNARVRCTSEGRGVLLVSEATSRDDGRFELADVPVGMSPTLEADAPGFAPLAVPLWESRREPTRPGSVLEHDLVLARGVRVKGRVYDAETNAPIADAVVGFHSWVSREGMGAGSRTKADRRAQTDERGVYAFDFIPSLGFHLLGSRVAGNPVGFLRVSAPGYAQGFVEVPSSPEGATLDLDVACWHTARVRGRVVDSEGKPVPRTTVWAYVRNLGNFQARSVTVGSDGRFVLDGIAAKTSGATPTEVFANPEDVGSLTPTAGEFAKHELNLKAGDDVEIPDLVLNPLLSVRLRVVDDRGLPISRARARSGLRGMGSETGEDGRCRVAFESRREGEKCNVRIWATGFASVLVDDVMPSRKPAETTVVLKPGRALHGRVLWSDRSPAKNVGVSLAQGQGAADFLVKGPEIGIWGDDYYKTFFATTQSDSEGRFELVDLPDGPYEIGAAAGGQLNLPDEAVKASVSNVREDGVEIVLPSDGAALREGFPLEGTVTFAKGRPVTSFWVALSMADRYQRAILPSVGRFRFERVPPGKWKLRIEGSGFVKVDRELVVEAGRPPARIDVVVEEGLSIVGTVRVPQDERLADVMVFFRGSDADVGIQAVIAADGSYRASGMVPGRYNVCVTYPNAGHWGRALAAVGPFTVEVKPGSSPTRRDIEVVRGGWLTVGIPPELMKGRGKAQAKVIDASGAVVSEWMIQEEPDIGGYGAQIPLPEGAYSLRLMAGETTIARAEATVSAAATASIQLE